MELTGTVSISLKIQNSTKNILSFLLTSKNNMSNFGTTISATSKMAAEFSYEERTSVPNFENFDITNVTVKSFEGVEVKANGVTLDSTKIPADTEINFFATDYLPSDVYSNVLRVISIDTPQNMSITSNGYKFKAGTYEVEVGINVFYFAPETKKITITVVEDPSLA